MCVVVACARAHGRRSDCDDLERGRARWHLHTAASAAMDQPQGRYTFGQLQTKKLFKNLIIFLVVPSGSEAVAAPFSPFVLFKCSFVICAFVFIFCFFGTVLPRCRNLIRLMRAIALWLGFRWARIVRTAN